ncbi:MULTISPECIES: hypothetical protein [unclassified Moorena]|uniref:hypothetical protein n=2 Tax=Moorena TaxID=1155738 RepID=UPI0025F53163|nr:MULTISPECIES: hypothetical protein [unclassified Moorena]
MTSHNLIYVNTGKKYLEQMEMSTVEQTEQTEMSTNPEPENKKENKKGLRGTPAQATTRLLLHLWDLGGSKQEVKRKDLSDTVKLNNERSGDYTDIFKTLETDGTIKKTKKARIEYVFLTEQGLEVLDAGIKSADFEFDGSLVRAKDVKAVLNWIRERSSVAKVVEAGADAGKTGENAIASYETFESVVLEVYDKLNQDYNLDDLVPIYRIRREIGDSVSRSQFNEWLLEMQANEILQLQGGSLPDSDPSKIEDSITTELSGLRCYAKRL